jgi:A/G-specific adenine glycosylase
MTEAEEPRAGRAKSNRRETPAPSRSPQAVAPLLLAWYDANARDLPWRARPGAPAPDPYRVWLSEVMLQQTTVAAVKPYFEGFLARWPRVADLAAAPTEEVMRAWAGLGYYARARNMHAAAKALAARGGFPDDEDGWRALPGVGAYTAAAVAAIAFGRRAVVVDGNVERVVSRLFAIEEPLPGARKALRAAADAITPEARAGDFAQAMMDLGAGVCAPRRPACTLCPLTSVCAGLARGLAETLPRKMAKAARPQRRGAVFWIESDGAALLRTRPETGLLGGMSELPGTDWREDFDPDDAPALAPLAADWVHAGEARHVFTHFALTLDVFVARLPAAAPAPEGCRWVALGDLSREALPTLMRKAIAVATR